MSSDYRPRGGSEGGSKSGGGGRRRRGGRGRSSHGGTSSHSENRVHTNGSSSTAPKKQESALSKLIGWFTGKKSKPESKHIPRSSSARPEFKEREPRADRPERTERPRREDRPPKTEPVPQEITSPKLYVGNLAYEAAESDLFDLFSKVGAVKNVEIAMDRHSSRSKGFGFVEMETLETAKEAASKLNRTDFMGRQIVVSGAKVDKRPTQSSPRDEDPTSHEHDATSSNPDATA
jgi:RNA recognition motif-containing protein